MPIVFSFYVFRPDGIDLELNNISQPDNSSQTGISIYNLHWKSCFFKLIHSEINSFFCFIKNYVSNMNSEKKHVLVWHGQHSDLVQTKDLMQGKIIAVAYTLRTYRT